MTIRLTLMAAASAGALALSAPALAQQVPPVETPAAQTTTPTPAAEQPSAAATGADTGIEEVVVTGTRRARSRLDTVAPVDVISSQTLQQQGTPELAQALANLAPSIDFPRPSVTDGTDAIRPATLRGLSPDQTLVLLNGTRVHTSALVNINGSIGRGSAPVDLNTIPEVALERVEVLRDGASAQYGSDAIAGVINLILRKARSGGEVDAQYGGYDTDVDARRSVQHREDGPTYSVSGWQGLPLGRDGFLTVSGEYEYRNPTNRSDIDPRVPNRAAVTGRFGDPEEEGKTFYANAGLPLGYGWEAYAFGGYQNRTDDSAAFPRLATVMNSNGTYSPNTAQVVSSLYPNGFLPIIDTEIDDYNAAGGVRGAFAGFAIDAKVGYGDNRVHYHTINTDNASLGADSPTSFDSGVLEYDQLTAQVDVTRPLDISYLHFAKPSTLAFGAEYRREGYRIEAGEPGSYAFGAAGASNAAAGAQGFPGLQPGNATDVHRDAGSVYLDLDSQVTDKLDVDLAGRFEDYSDFGTTATGKVAARYDFTSVFALRGAVSSGFRAPSLQQQFFTATSSNQLVLNGVSQIVLAGTFPATSATAGQLGGQQLQPEQSTNYSAGAVFHRGGLELTVDAYRIYVYDRIVLSETLTGSTAAGTTPAAITSREIYALLNPPGTGTNIQGARFFINGVNTRTDGIDVVGRYHTTTDLYGRFDFTLAANINHTDVTKVPTTSQVSGLAAPPSLFARANVLTFEKGTPQQKYVGSVDWSFGPVGATLRATHYSTVYVPSTNPLLDYETGSRWLFDAEGRYRLPFNVTVALGVSNLTDQYPKSAPLLVNTTGAAAFSSYSPFGFNGRFWYGRLSLAW